MDSEKIKVFASDKNWIEGKALSQLKNTAMLPGILRAVGMPDIHPGKGCPVGAAFLSEGLIYPHIVGNDIGCGMGLWKTSIKKGKFKRDKYAKRLKGLEMAWHGNTAEWLSKNNLNELSPDSSLGTIGGGNHFAELQVFDKIYDLETFEEMKLDKNFVMLLTHSGSRGHGEALFRKYAEKYGAEPISAESEEGKDYLNRHDLLLEWAKANRQLIAERTAGLLGCEIEKILDACHNSVLKAKENFWLHRKGAASSEGGPIVVAGTRGSLSYLVAPADKQEDCLFSAPHGAGRKWIRSSVRKRLERRFNVESLKQTEIGSLVICEDKELLYQEAPQAYKNIEAVMQDMLDYGLVSVIATLRPVITYKTRKRR